MGIFFCFVFINQSVFHYFTHEWKGQPHVQKGMNHASLCITRTCSCAYFEELSNDMDKWCNALSQHCIHVVCNGVCSRPNSLTSAAYSQCCRPILAAQHSRTCWTSHRGPAGVLDLLQPLVTHDQCCEMIPDNQAYVSCKNSSTHDWITRKVWKNLILNQIICVINHVLAIRRQFVGLTDQY